MGGGLWPISVEGACVSLVISIESVMYILLRNILLLVVCVRNFIDC